MKLPITEPLRVPSELAFVNSGIKPPLKMRCVGGSLESITVMFIADTLASLGEPSSLASTVMLKLEASS